MSIKSAPRSFGDAFLLPNLLPKAGRRVAHVSMAQPACRGVSDALARAACGDLARRSVAGPQKVAIKWRFDRSLQMILRCKES